MRRTMWLAGAASLAVMVPLVLVRASEDPETQEVKVKVESAGKAEGKQESGAKVIVRRIDGGDGEEKVIELRLGDDAAAETKKETYLGVALAPVPPALVAHLPGVLSGEQGLLVAHVMPESPAEKAGLQVHDILLSYDDQKIFSGDQLTKLVRGDKPGREVALSVVRAGKTQKVTVTLSEHQVKAKAMFHFTPELGEFQTLFGEHAKAFSEHAKALGEQAKTFSDQAKKSHMLWLHKDKQGAAKGDAKNRFSSMTLRSTDGDRFKAEIEYKGDDGETKKWSFEGTRDEIRKELESNEELPKDIRDHMLRSLDVSGGKAARPGSFGLVTPFGSDFNFQFNLPDFDEMFEQLDDQLGGVNQEMIEELRGKLRSIESHPKAIIRDQSL